MQTNFTPTQLQDPDISAANDVLRSCVHCGFCTATCPTFVLLGDELDSPRGRIYLIKDMLENDRPATEDVTRHVDRCLSCLSCMTTCPSGVHYMHLIDMARTHVERTYRRPWADRLMRQVLGRILPNTSLFRIALMGAAIGRLAVGAIPAGMPLGRRLRAMLALTPARIPPPSPSETPATHPAQGTKRGRVALLTGCAQPALAPEINEATIRLLTRLGIEVVVTNSGCCGSLNHHLGQHDAAMGHARSAIEAWLAEPELDAIIINTSGCGTTIKDYGFMFRAEPAPWPAQAERVAALAMDISEYLTRIGYQPSRPPSGLTVAYHAACSLQHGQKIINEPKALLRKAGFRVVEPADSHLCCGSAGTYNILQSEIATRLRTRKLRTLRNTKPDLIAAGNIGCITQLSGDGVPVVHSVALLDWAAGGPIPAPIAGLPPKN